MPMARRLRSLTLIYVVNPEFVNDPVYNLGIGTSGTNAGYFDIESVITHEIGHIIGLLHSGIVTSTMFFTIDEGITVRSLEQDDKSWASYRYPKLPDYNNAYGSISGTITYGYGLQPIAGALVIAINTVSLDTVHGYSDASGYYLVPGLPPGTYKIYIEPLDGDVNGYNLKPGNISLYLYSNTVYTDYPGEYYNDSDSDNDSGSEDRRTDSYSTINVSAGSNTGGKNLITNIDLTHPSILSVSPADGTTGFDIVKDITVKFSEPVDETTLNAQTFYLESSGVKHDGSCIRYREQHKYIPVCSFFCSEI